MPSSASGVRALVVGFGSIGARHAEVLQGLGCDVALASRRAADISGPYPAFADLTEAMATHAPDYVVVADETARHRATLECLADGGFAGRVLVEKPLFDAPAELPDLPFAALGVGYNLRFHPAVQALRAALGGRRALSVEASVGQHLPDWRPGTDYRQSYSADRARGGGVLRDLSHEIDLLIWLFGVPHEVAALGGKVSELEIDSDDAWSALLRQPGSAMTSLHLDYLHRPGRRQFSVTASDRSLDLDLIAATLTVNGERQSFPAERNASFAAMHAAMLDATAPRGTAPAEVCDAATGLAVLRTISAVERSAAERVWMRP